MALRPILPVMPDETLTSYMTRVAAYHGRMDLRAFLSTIEIPQSALINPKITDVDQFAEITGIPVETLLRMTFVSLGERVRSIRGLEVSTEFVNYDQTSFCPACLLEDGHPDSPSGGHRIGRLTWRIRHVRCCPHHGIALIRRRHSHPSERLQDLTVLAPGDDELQDMLEGLPALTPSDLPSYLDNRIAGGTGPQWLDSQPLDLAARACEMLGIILSKGSHCNLNVVTDDEWHDAGHLGFGFAARGEDGIREALGVMFDRFLETGRSGGPQKVLGRLYQWLQFNKNRRPKGPIQEVVREYILDHFPLETGDILFGEPVRERRVHTVATLAVYSGEHYKTIKRAIILTGLAHGDPEKTLGSKPFNAQAAENLVYRIQRSVTVLALPAILNCNRTQAEQLVRRGLIKRISDDDKARGLLKNIPIEEVEGFLSRFMSCATKVDSPSEGMLDIVTASKIARWPFMDIITAILSGDLSKVEVVDPNLKFKGVLVQPDEVTRVMKQSCGDGLLELKEAAQLFGWPQNIATPILNMKTPEGLDYIPKKSFRNAKGRVKRYVHIDDVRAFRATHATLAELARARSMAPRCLLAELKLKGISPLPVSSDKPVGIYRLADVPA